MKATAADAASTAMPAAALRPHRYGQHQRERRN